VQQVFSTRILGHAYLVRDALQNAGVWATVRGEHLIAGETMELGPSVWVADTDAEEAGRLLEEGLAAAERESVLADMAADASTAAADELAHATMADLFVVADRLGRTPTRGELHEEVCRLGPAAAELAPPFGMAAATWDRIGALSAEVVTAVTVADYDRVAQTARALRAFLRDYV
jgi:hypothetical protein